MSDTGRCKTCVHFEAKALHDSIPICHHADMEVDTGTGRYVNFQPPTYDGDNFGCVLWELPEGAIMFGPAPTAQLGVPRLNTAAFEEAVKGFGVAVQKVADALEAMKAKPND